MKLHTEVIEGRAAEAGGSTIRVLHGIYGRGRNLGRLARGFVDANPGWRAELVDLRGHGGSPPGESPHTVGSAARDVVALGGVPRILLGHSFGGKVALITLRDPEFRPDQVWVVDSSPSAREPTGLPWRMIGYLRAHPGPFEGREDAVEALRSEGVPLPVGRWMATNLERGEDGALRWGISPDVMEELLLSYFEEDAWDVVEGGKASCPIHFVKATDSPVLGGDDVARIRRAASGGDVHFHEVEGGHWLHADNVEGLLAVLEANLP